MHFYGRRCVTLRIFILGQCVALRIKIGNFMKVAHSTSCFSNDSDYYRGYLKWKQLKERRLLN